LRTPTQTLSFDQRPRGEGAAAVAKYLQSQAMRWNYVLRNRERWTALPKFAETQAEDAADTLKQLGLSEQSIEVIAKEQLVEVEIPFSSEEAGWEARIFPWEFILAGATRKARHGNALTVLRHLAMTSPKSSSTAMGTVLYVESAPGPLRDLYSFETESKLTHWNLKPTRWLTLATPTLQELRETVRAERPGVIHLAGFDSHQGLRLVSQSAANQANTLDDDDAKTKTIDGYLLASKDGTPLAVTAEALAEALCANGHRPALVSFSLQNSAARIAPMAIAKGAGAAIGFQDVFDDGLVELFFGTFYRVWRESRWNLLQAFRMGWETVRAQPASHRGSGLVLWSDRELVQSAARARPQRLAERKRVVWMPGDIPANDSQQVLSLKIEPFKELNYSLLHNRSQLFEQFTLINGSVAYKKNEFATIADIDVSVTLGAGPEAASYQRRISLDEASIELADKVHLPLTSELLRSVHESINSTMVVEVSWGRPIHRDSYKVRLLPVDQWRDNDRDGQWLPSFVLPRDSAVTSLVDKAQRYVRVLRDDPSAGFDGYQSVDLRAQDPSREVDLQVQAIWSTIVHELKLGYINPPPSYNTVMDSQRLRTPSTIVSEGAGTCLDLALLIAACCELIDVYPVIFLLQDHAFPGYWRRDTCQEDFLKVSTSIQQDMGSEERDRTKTPGAQRVGWWFRDVAYEEIVKQVKLGFLVPLESVWLTEHSGFWEAVDGGKDNLKSKRRFHSMLDIARARAEGVTPIPISVRS
jgi:hypothetical protein